MASDNTDAGRNPGNCQHLGGWVATVPTLEIVEAELYAGGKNDLSGEVGAGGMDSTLMQDRSGI